MPSAGPTVAPREWRRRPVFIDRNSGGRLFKGLIEQAGIEVHLHDERFSKKTEDPKWLTALGDSRWLLVSGDNEMTRLPLFLQQLSESKAHVFILLGMNGETREGKAACVVQAYAQMCRLADLTRPPAIWRIGKDGKAREVPFRQTLEKMKRGRR